MEHNVLFSPKHETKIVINGILTLDKITLVIHHMRFIYIWGPIMHSCRDHIYSSTANTLSNHLQKSGFDRRANKGKKLSLESVSMTKGSMKSSSFWNP